MELPFALRQTIEHALEHTPLPELAKAAEALSQRYRAEVRDGRWHVSSDLAAKAYLATRMPATYAAIRASLNYLAELHPDFSPHTFLDVGSGPGTALWAAEDCWESLETATLLEGSEAMRRWGEQLGQSAATKNIHWQTADIAKPLPSLNRHDLVTLAYVLDELEPAQRTQLIEGLWALTEQILLIVEPGTPTGWQRMLEARAQLIELGSNLIAPCPHSQSCPLTQSDWCHFSRRVSRSRLHRQAKGGDVPWEDEKFIYLAVSRFPSQTKFARVIGPTKLGSGHVRLRLCKPDGSENEEVFSKRQGEVFKVARRLDWGDALEEVEGQGSGV